MGDTVTRLAPAKINLTLHVTGQRADGYHLLDSLVCFADFGDRISVSHSDEMGLDVIGPLAQGVPTDASNLVLKAAQLIAPDVPLHITLEKHLPAAAGIGGGSADAAATLRCISDLLNRSLPENCEGLGADVPVCLYDTAVRMQGVGEVITPVPALPLVHAVLVNPRVAVSTPVVFSALPVKENAPIAGVERFSDVGHLTQWLSQQRNDLQAPAIDAFPVIADVLGAMDTAVFAAMSGSGATCYGMFESARDAADAAAKIMASHPRWWVQTCQFF